MSPPPRRLPSPRNSWHGSRHNLAQRALPPPPLRPQEQVSADRVKVHEVWHAWPGSGDAHGLDIGVDNRGSIPLAPHRTGKRPGPAVTGTATDTRPNRPARHRPCHVATKARPISPAPCPSPNMECVASGIANSAATPHYTISQHCLLGESHPHSGLGVPVDPATLPPLPALDPTTDPDPTAVTLSSLESLSAAFKPPSVPSNTSSQLPNTLDSVPIPAKLRKRILDLEFVEMHELLPEAWGIEATQSCCPGSRRQTRRAPVQDILLWTECFSSLVAILGSAHPHHIADFMAYQRSIVRASRIFEGNAWVVYDRCYRRRAALTKDLNWAVQCTALYNEAFTGRARTIPRCSHCLSENHSVSDCPDLPQGPVTHTHLAPMQPSRPPPNTATTRAYPAAPNTTAVSEYRRLFNQIRCRSRRCRYTHLCNICSLPHPAQVCPTRARRDRSPLPPMSHLREPAQRPPLA